MSLSIVTGLNPRARHEATNASTHSDWNCHGSVVGISCGTAPPAMTYSLTSLTGIPSSHLNGQGSTLKIRQLPREPTRTAGGGYGQVAAATLVREQVPAPDRWGETFSDDVVAAAMIDRLVHHAEVLTLTGDSYRTRQRRELLAKENRTHRD